MDKLIQDVRYGIRVLLKKPGFLAITILTLALGIGANTAIFSVVNGVLLRPLPYTRPGQLITVWGSFPKSDFLQAGLTQLEFVRLRNESQSFSQVGSINFANLTLTGTAEPERIPSAVVSANLLDLLGVNVALGRAFLPGEDEQSRANVVVLSYGFWQRHFAANSDVVGQSLTLSGINFTVVGVLPRDFQSPLDLQTGTESELYVPLRLNMGKLDVGSHGLNTVARLGEGMSLQQAQAETAEIIGRVVQENPSFYPEDGSFHSYLMSLHETITGDVRLALLVFLGAVAFVLLIACANVANLLLAYGEGRQKEMAIRAALGASRGRIIRQLLVESVILAIIGGVMGLLIAVWGVDALLALNPQTLPRLHQIGIDWHVLGFALLISLFTGLLFGFLPALHTVKTDLHFFLKSGGRTSSSQSGRSPLRQGLVIAEVAFALVLLIGAGLLMKSFWRLRQIDLGLNPKSLLTMRMSLPASAYQNNQQVSSFYEKLIERVHALPGVQDVAVAAPLPISGRNNDTMMEIEGVPFEGSGVGLSTDYRIINPEYFRAMGIRLVGGRLLTETDNEATPRVAIINETLARNHWGSEDPVGKRLRLLDAPPAKATTPFITVIGVVADVKNRALAADTRQEVYIPLRQHEGSLGAFGVTQSFDFAVRTTSEPMSLANAVRQEVWAIDRNVPIANLRTMEQVVGAAVVQPRFNMILLGIFALVALALGAVGIYGVMSFAVSRRTSEIGIRMALGAQNRDVLKMIVGQGMKLAAIGIAIGVVAAMLLTRLMQKLLFNISPTDPTTFVLIIGILTGVILLACYTPARRALRVDPMVALRFE